MDRMQASTQVRSWLPSPYLERTGRFSFILR